MNEGFIFIAGHRIIIFFTLVFESILTFPAKKSFLKYCKYPFTDHSEKALIYWRNSC